MKPADRTKFVEVVLGFAELKGKQLTAAALELYWRAMQHWDISDFLAASEQLLRTSEYMPTPKEFEDLRKAGRPTAGEAWSRVLNHVRSGRYSGVQSDTPVRLDELTERAVRALGGYHVIAMSHTEKTHFLEKRFCEHYEEMREAAAVREAVPQIAHSGSKFLGGPQSAQALLGNIKGRS